jgi:hypothetical protein
MVPKRKKMCSDLIYQREKTESQTSRLELLELLQFALNCAKNQEPSKQRRHVRD